MEFLEKDVPGCFEIVPDRHLDARGRFVKVFNERLFADRGLEIGNAEEYYSISIRNVVRGLHFQVPPSDHAKMVYCVAGEVVDAAVDLRMGSPTFGRHIMVRLSAQSAHILYLPRGIAHGFAVTSDSATLIYRTSSVHDPAADRGIRWDSAGIQWGVDAPIVSERDASLPGLDDFASPFTYHPCG